jgi:hypothetical protein
MADRTTRKIYETKGADRLAVPMANGVTLPVGTLVQSESGFANHYDGTAGKYLLGIVLGGENLNSSGNPVGDTTLTPDPNCYVDASGVVLTGIAVASSTVVGVYVYCNDSDIDGATVTQPSTDAPIGFIVGWRSATDVDVKLFTLLEHAIGQATTHATWL